MNLVKNSTFRQGLLASLVSFVLVGCGSSNSASTKPTKPTVPSKPTAPVITELDKTLKVAFPRSTNVFGIAVRGTEKTSTQAIQHAAKVLAAYLDNNQDGTVDNEAVVAKLVEKSAALIIATTEVEMQKVTEQHFTDEMLKNASLQDLYASEIYPNGSDVGEFDATLEETLHLISQFGYSEVYPDIFAAKPGSSVADAMDIARGGHFKTVPVKYPELAWYTYDDESCNYACMTGEYTYWALTSILGAQEFEGRLEAIEHEWKLNSKNKVEKQDPAIYNILTNSKYDLPTQLPDGNYAAIKFEVKGVVVDAKKQALFSYMTEQHYQNIAVYGAKGVEKAAYDRAVADVNEVVSALNSDVRQGLLNAGVKMLVIENEDALIENLDYLLTLLPVEAVFSNAGGSDETLINANGLSTTKLELMYLIVYYALLTEEDLAEQYLQLQTAYKQAADGGLFTPGDAYKDGNIDDAHLHASNQNALKYGSYLFNLANVYFGNDLAEAGEFSITTRDDLEAKNPLGYAFVEALFDSKDEQCENGGYEPAAFTFKEEDFTKVYMNGVITCDTLTVVNKLLADHPQINTLVLQNVPGSMDDEINLLASRAIRKHNIATHVPADGMVASGGTDMFLAGVKRSIETGAKVGVHAWAEGDSEATDFSEGHEKHKGYLSYYNEMGIPEAFYWFTINAAKADGMHWMDEAEMRKYSMLAD